MSDAADTRPGNVLGATVVAALVVLHLGVSLLHDGAHQALGVVLNTWQTAFVYAVIVAAPLVGAVLGFTRHSRLGAALVVGGMLGALAFGVVHHYVWVSPDHISHLPEGPAHEHGTFIWTAGAIAILEGVCAGAAAYLLGGLRGRG